MFGKWHVVMPLMTMLCGYFPGKRLGWLEDTPAGVVRDWSMPTAQYEKRPSGRVIHATNGQLPFSNVTAKTLAISLSDDPYGTIPAIERLLGYFTGSTTTHLRIDPEDIGEEEVGHFAFFRSAYQATLWPIALSWLQTGELAPDTPGGECHAVDGCALSTNYGTMPMASANKQNKRASRAKAKAKQNRTQRAAAPVELDPNDDRIDFESVDLTELFKKMIDAEKNSQQAMCAAFLEDPLLELVYEQEGEEGAMDFILAALIEYRQWSTETDEAGALAWIESPAFQADYVAASDAIAAQTQQKPN